MGGVYMSIELSQRNFDKVMQAKQKFFNATGETMTDSDFLVVLIAFATKMFNNMDLSVLYKNLG